MAHSFSRQFTYNKKSHLAVIVPQLRQDGMYYEVNIQGYSRFFMSWSPLGRYDIAPGEAAIPYELILAVSDLLENEVTKKK